MIWFYSVGSRQQDRANYIAVIWHSCAFSTFVNVMESAHEFASQSRYSRSGFYWYWYDLS
jgi:hypothetical protein